MKHPKSLVLRYFVAGATVMFFFFVVVSTGLFSALFPFSIALVAPSFFVWENRLIDPLASLVLIGLMFLAIGRANCDASSEPTFTDHHSANTTAAEDPADAESSGVKASPSLDSLNEPRSNAHAPKFSGMAFRRIAMFALVPLVLVTSLISRALTDDHPSETLVTHAIDISSSGQVVPALESIMQVIPKRFTSSALNLYYFASGWEDEIGAWPTAEELDILLVRSSVAIESPYTLIVGLIQYDQAKEAPLPRWVDKMLLSSTTSKAWRLTAEAAITWQATGNDSGLIERLNADYAGSTSGLQSEIGDAIELAQSYVKRYSDVK